MDGLKDLKDLVRHLEDATSKERIKDLLCAIGDMFLKAYELRVKNIVIEPLRVEPYFYKENIFEDKFIHHDIEENRIIYGPQQRNRFGEFYIHKGYSGVDIVLSQKKDYAFSLLIKNSRVLINNECKYPFLKQYGIAQVLKENGILKNHRGNVLYKKEKPNDKNIVFRTIRNGLKTIAERDDFRKSEQEKYNELLISSFIELKEHTSSQYDFEPHYGGDRAVVEYLKKYKKEHPDKSIAELDEMRKSLYPNGSKTEFRKAFIEKK